MPELETHMRLAVTLLTGLIAFSSPALADSISEKANRGDVIDVPTEDPDMAAAMRKAQETLPDFLKALDGGRVDSSKLSVKLKVVDSDATEHFWASDVKRSGNGFTATLANQPVNVTNVTFGQTMTFKAGDIEDWIVMDGDTMRGSFTTCVLIKRQPPEEGEAYARQIGLHCD